MAIQASDFQYVRDLVQRETSIVLEAGREYLVESRLLTLARQENAAGIEQLMSAARSNRDPRLTRRIVEAMTTNETSFFRDPNFFEGLKTVVLPDLIAKRKAEKKLTIWCAACSSGQEPYSIAMMLKELSPKMPDFRIEIIATDFCEKMVEKSRSGLYSQLEVNRGLPTKLLLQWFERSGADFRVKEEVRRMIEFRQLNLAASTWPNLPPLDLVFLRNVLIYFNLETKRGILQRARRLMRSDATLVLGSTETTFNVDPTFDRYEAARAIFYRLREV